jgi:diaminopimelate epimerase
MSALEFAKYQAAGNDFILVEDLDADVHLDADEVRTVCDRWFGIGGDGLIRVRRGPDAIAMDLVNADGTPAETSGNGLRCLAAFVYERDLVEGPAFEVETRAGVRSVLVQADSGRVVRATVGMGVPAWTRAEIPMRGPAWETFVGQPFDLGAGLTATATAVSMGNPHLVLFLDEDPERFHVEHIGPAIETHEWFPERTNVEFARVRPDGIDVRVWERGVGETLACGTGACAVAAAAYEAGLGADAVALRFRGGTLEVQREDGGELTLGGPVGLVCTGTVDPSRL